MSNEPTTRLKAINLAPDEQFIIQVDNANNVNLSFVQLSSNKLLVTLTPQSLPTQEEPAEPGSGILPAPAVLEDGTIEGHPNCKIGECNDCHVVWCEIYQGYRAMPHSSSTSNGKE